MSTMTSKAKLPIAKLTHPQMTPKTMNSEHIAKSDSKGSFRTFAMFPSDADTVVQSTSHGLGEPQMDDNFETLSDISSSDLRRNLPPNIDGLSDICGALNDEVSISSWKHPDKLPYLDEDQACGSDELGGEKGLSIVGQSGGVHGINLPCNMREPDDSIAHDAELNEKLDRMVFNARVSGVEKTLQLPWDAECFSGIFAARESIFPQVDSDLVCFENPSQSTHDSIPGPVDDFLKLDHMQSCFESAISFRAGRTRSMKLDAQFDIMYQRWTAIVLMNPMASSSGRMLAEFKHAFGDDWGKCCKVVAQYLGGKSVATLKKRYGQVSRYIAYVETELFSAPFPLVKHVVFDYLNSLAEKDEFSATQGFVECLNFLQHVLGFDVPVNFLADPWISGVLRGLRNKRPTKKQSRTLKVTELKFLEAFLENETKSVIDRYAAGCFLMMVYSRARVGDMAAIKQCLADVSPYGEGLVGYLEVHSLSHKSRSTTNALGLNMSLVAPMNGLGEKCWGKTFLEISKRVGLDFDTRKSGEPLLPAPDVSGGWSSRPVTSREVKKWLCIMLKQMQGFDPTGLTGHGLKATTLSMLSKFGASEEVRLILGHHSLRKKSTLESYSRDIQAAPLRVLESMFLAIKKGQFHPDMTRSGMVSEQHLQQSYNSFLGVGRTGSDVQVVGEKPVIRLQSEPYLHQNEVDCSETNVADDCIKSSDEESPDLQVEKMDYPDPGDSDSASSSSESEFTDDEVLRTLQIANDVPEFVWREGCSVFQNSKTKTLHLLPAGVPTTFLCGRELNGDCGIFRSRVFSSDWKCRQCDRGRPIRSVDGMCLAFDRALKRLKKV